MRAAKGHESINDLVTGLAGLNVVSVERGGRGLDGHLGQPAIERLSGMWCTVQITQSQYLLARTLRVGPIRPRNSGYYQRIASGAGGVENQLCDRRIFTERVPGLASPFARRTARLAEIVRLIGYNAGGGRPLGATDEAAWDAGQRRTTISGWPQ